jgi:hypothetical protein
MTDIKEEDPYIILVFFGTSLVSYILAVSAPVHALHCWDQKTYQPQNPSK